MAAPTQGIEQKLTFRRYKDGVPYGLYRPGAGRALIARGKKTMSCLFNNFISRLNWLGRFRHVLILLLVSSVANAETGNDNNPPLQMSKPDQCVEPTDLMRRDHMKFLMHQRDATVIDGIRTKKHSLTGCIECHAQPKEDGTVVRIDNPEHFCAGCHQFTGVKIDCFECHSDKPLTTAYRHKIHHEDLQLSGFDSGAILEPPLSSKLLRLVIQQVDINVE